MALFISHSPIQCRPRHSDLISPLQYLDALMYPEAALDAITQSLSRETGQVRVVDEKDKYGFHIGVGHFKPEELSIRVVENELIVEGKHEEKDERGFISRNFSRRYLIPDNVEKEKLQSRLVKGVLQIEAPKKAVEEEKPKEVNIPITFENKQ